jgi:hypothetical protein
VATYVAATRLTDYVHHFSDVNAGSFIGLMCGSACYHLHFGGTAGERSAARPSAADVTEAPARLPILSEGGCADTELA